MSVPAGAVLVGERWKLAGQDLDFGTALSGRGQVVAGVTPLWTAVLTYRVPMMRENDWLAWEAWVEARRGRLIGDSIVPRGVRGFADLARDEVTGSLTFTDGITFTGGVRFRTGKTFDGGVTFDDGVTFDGGLPANPERLWIEKAASQYATRLTIAGRPPGAGRGRFIWINDSMYRIINVAGGIVDIAPPLRAPVAAHTPAAGAGTLRMILASASEGVLDHEKRAHQRVSISLIEEL